MRVLSIIDVFTKICGNLVNKGRTPLHNAALAK